MNDYPLLEAFWTIALVALWALWIFLVIWTLLDNFRRSDHGGWSKALWTLFIIFLPLLGIIAYVVARPTDIGGSFGPPSTQSDPRWVIPTADRAGELAQLSSLRDSGTLTESEFQAQKQRILD